MLPVVSTLSPPAEAKRLATLQRYGILGTPPEETFTRLTQLVAAAFEVSGALISFVGKQRVFYKAYKGASGRSYPRTQTLCYAAAFAGQPLVLEDVATTKCTLAFVKQHGVRFYTGVPLTAPGGAVLGALSVFGSEPRAVAQVQIELLETLAQTVMDLLAARRTELERTQTDSTGARLTALLERAPYYAFSTSADGRLEYLSAPLESALDYRSPPGHYRDLYPPEAQYVAAAAFAETLAVGQAQLTTTLLTGAGTLLPVSQELVRCGDVREPGVAVLARDTSAQGQRDAFEQKRAEVLELTARGAPLPAILLELIRLLETYCEGLIGAVFLVQDGTLQLEVAPQLPSTFSRLLQTLPLGEAAAAPGKAVLSGKRVVTTDIRHDPLWHQQRYYALQNGLQACWAEPILSDQNDVLGTFVLYARETKAPTEAEGRLLRETAQLAAIAVSRQKLYAQLEHQARYDALTGLPNRRLLHEHLGRAVRQAKAQEGGVSVLLLDLDNFKQVNDTLGHSAGDVLLTEVAERLQMHLQTHLPPRTTLARSGGDEFVVIAPLEHPGDAARFAFELTGAFTAPFALGERTLQVEASIGVSRYPEDAGTFEALLQAADTAMYAAKADRRAGDNQGYRLYRSELTAQLEAQLKLEAELKRAFVRNEFRIFSQPRFDIARQCVTGSEVLVRWQHPEAGLLLPGAFLDGAQKAGLLPQIDGWVLREAARHLSEGAASGRPTRLSCNVSAASFQDRTFLGELETVLGGDPAVPVGLELEITESLLMQNLGGIAAQLADLKVRFPGIRVAIDDFGSGYSSLSYLRHLPIDTLKIDRAFVRDLDHHDGKLQRTALAVIRTVIALGHDLGFFVVAEGAETAAQLGMLTALGVDEVQGFAIGRPQPIDERVFSTTRDPLNSSRLS